MLFWIPIIKYTNMNMNAVYYFKVYAELRYVIAKLLPYVKKTVIGGVLAVFSFIRSPGN